MASFPNPETYPDPFSYNGYEYNPIPPGYYGNSYSTTMHQPVYYTNTTAVATWEVSKPVEEPKAEPVISPGAGWLDGELDEVMSLGRAEPVLA